MINKNLTKSVYFSLHSFRSAKDIAEGIQLLTKDDFSVVSVNEMNDPLQLSLSVDLESNIANPEAVISPRH